MALGRLTDNNEVFVQQDVTRSERVFLESSNTSETPTTCAPFRCEHFAEVHEDQEVRRFVILSV